MTKKLLVFENKSFDIDEYAENDIICQVKGDTLYDAYTVGVDENGQNARYIIDKDGFDKLSNEDKLVIESDLDKTSKNMHVYWFVRLMHEGFYQDSGESSSIVKKVSKLLKIKKEPRKPEINSDFYESFSQMEFDSGNKNADESKDGGNDINESDDGTKNNEPEDGEVSDKDETSSKRPRDGEDDKEISKTSKKSKMSDVIMDMDVNDANDFEDYIINMMELYDEATMYEGYDSKTIRKNFISKCSNCREFVDLLLKSLLVYVRVGNNPDKLNSKRNDDQVSKILLKKISSLGIQTVARDKGTLTLPRIGRAFMNELIIARGIFISDVQDQVPDSCESRYQDTAFAGCSLINSKSGYDKFYSEFTALISNKGKGYAEDDSGQKKLKSDCKRWTKISVDGYNKDKVISSRSSEALNIKDKSGSIKFIENSYEIYRKEN